MQRHHEQYREAEDDEEGSHLETQAGGRDRSGRDVPAKTLQRLAGEGQLLAGVDHGLTTSDWQKRRQDRVDHNRTLLEGSRTNQRYDVGQRGRSVGQKDEVLGRNGLVSFSEVTDDFYLNTSPFIPKSTRSCRKGRREYLTFSGQQNGDVASVSTQTNTVGSGSYRVHSVGITCR